MKFLFRFEICRKLGQGTYGKVQLGINKETGQQVKKSSYMVSNIFQNYHHFFTLQVAIKTIKKSKIETEADLIRIRREIQIMSSVQHPNIIHIYEGKIFIPPKRSEGESLENSLWLAFITVRAKMTCPSVRLSPHIPSIPVKLEVWNLTSIFLT